MDSLANLLNSRKPQEPEQFQKIKKYIMDNHNAVVKISALRDSIVITVPTAPLSTIIRMEVPKIQKACDFDQKVIIRIG